MQLSDFGRRFSGPSGIVDLMEDLGHALAQGGPAVRMLGGGNPAHIPAVEAELRSCLQAVLDDPVRCGRMLGNYDPPAGHPGFRSALAVLLQQHYGWPLGPEHIFLANGSQAGFFLLFNLIAGADQHIQLPLVPEYIGYGDLGLHGPLFRAMRPRIETLGDQRFKYRVDFDQLHIDDSCAALCVSRPTNPTGNVLTDEELRGLSTRCRAAGVPLIIDNAYGLPFPNIIFRDATPFWDEEVILCMSLSKFGLPACRCGIIIAAPSLIDRLARANTIACLASGSVGPEIGLELIRRERLLDLSATVIRPFYQQRQRAAVALLDEALADLPCRIHEPEGALFLWLWCPALPIGSHELYQRCKARGLLVIPGDHFFPGLEDPAWPHQRECLRISYAQDEARVHAGLLILAEEVRRAYRGASADSSA